MTSPEAQQIQLAPLLDVFVLDANTVVLQQGETIRRLRGRAYSQLCQHLIDGPVALTRLTELARDLPQGDAALGRLQEMGALTSSTPVLPLTAHWAACGISPDVAANCLRGRMVGVEPAHPLANLMANALRAQGVQVTSGAGSSRQPVILQLLLVDDYLAPRLAAFNREALESGQLWLPMTLSSPEAWCGPVLNRHDGPCWQCLATALAANREVASAVTPRALRVSRAGQRSSADPRATGAVERAAAQVADWLVRSEAAPLHRALCRLPPLAPEDGSQWQDMVLRRPHCSACGSPRAAPAPPVLDQDDAEPAAATVTDAQQRFLRKARPLINPTTGVVTALQRQSDDDDWAHSYLAVHSASVGEQNPESLAHKLASKAAGKGETDLAARVSAVGEAIERFSCCYHGDEYRLLAAAQALPPERVIAPDTCLLLGANQHTPAWRQRFPDLAPQVPALARLPQATPLNWSLLWSLGSRQWHYLPQAMVHLHAPQPTPPCCLADSSGCAAGPNPAAAALNGLLELIERDAVAIWWYNRLRRPPAQPAGLDAWLAVAQERHASRDRHLQLLDLTSDLGVPVVAAVSMARTGPATICLGFGAGLTQAEAARAAVIELNQRLPFADAWQQGSPRLRPSAAEARWWQRGQPEDHPHLIADPAGRAPTAQHWSPGSSDARQFRQLSQALLAAGFDVLLTELTRPEIGIPVMRVVVPGLRPAAPRFAPGRLFDVPVRTGERTAPLDEMKLNDEPPFW